MPLRTTDRDIAAVCLVPPGNVAREIAAFKRRLFAVTGEARALAVPDMAILVAAPWNPGLGSRDGRLRMKAAFESAWSCMEGRFRLMEAAIASGWLVLALENLPPAMIQRLFPALGVPSPIFESPFPALPSFPLYPPRDEATDLAAAAGAGPPGLAFRTARLALLRFRLAETDDGLSALSWTGITAVRRRTGPKTTGGL